MPNGNKNDGFRLAGQRLMRSRFGSSIKKKKKRLPENLVSKKALVLIIQSIS